MKSKWIHRLLIKQQGAYHLVNLYTYWSKLSSQWLVNSSKASCSLRLLRGVPITNGESAKYNSLVWFFPTKSTQEAILYSMEAEVSGSKVSSDGKITLGWKAKIGSCRSESILPFIDTYANGPNWLAAIAAPLVRTCCMPCQLRSVPSKPQQSKCTEKETRCSGALNSGENAYFVSRTFCSHLLNWCSFSSWRRGRQVGAEAPILWRAPDLCC